ncbi:conserved hypothetical protein [Sporisorium reilianum SRZ2]|uniref:FAD-binding PCMH-type domain-containing protein n=1 Tax=Sporisorium reilianum (strain SRZ2) TaxID=999809 RepID=E6ZNZ9_SPORE|nr:conserved hypothetical protein [Sporisorium reilianum SRZ2]
MRFSTLAAFSAAAFAVVATPVLCESGVDAATCASASAAASAASACAELTAVLPTGTVLTPSANSSAYVAAQSSSFNVLNSALRPTCIVRPRSTLHVSVAMARIFAHGAHYAVRAGGHTGMRGWDGVAAGVLLDLSLLTAFRYDAAARVVHVGPGLRWEQIYALAAPHGVAPLGGRVGHVGTGLLLGGGLSLLSPQHGYACDGVVGVEVVLVDGRVREVDATDALLRAIKGGGGRFGIVTRYTLRAFHTGTRAEKRWYAGTVTTLDRAGMDAMVQLTEEFVRADDDPRATMLANVGTLKQNGTTLWVGTTFLFYHGTRREFERVFAGFLAIDGAAVDARPMSYHEATQLTPLGWSAGQAYKWLGGSLYPSHPSTYLSLWRNIQAFLTQHHASLNTAFLSITPVRTHQIEQGYRAGGNALSPPPGRSFMHWQLSNILDPGAIAFPHALEQARLRLIRDNPSSKGLPLLLNEVDASQSVFETYGWVEEMKKVYASVDPTRFSVLHQQGPMF